MENDRDAPGMEDPASAERANYDAMLMLLRTRGVTASLRPPIPSTGSLSNYNAVHQNAGLKAQFRFLRHAVLMRNAASAM
jgi:hypothetical protein